MLSKWIRLLEEAVECDPDRGDPYLCLDEVDSILKKMKEEDFNTFKTDDNWVDKTRKFFDGK